MATKRYYWLKLKEDFFDDDTISFIEEQENGVYYVNFYLKLCLKSVKTEGKLIRLIGENLIPYDIKSLSKVTNTPVDTVRVAMKLFEEIGLIKLLESGEIYLQQIDELIGTETDRARIMREKRAIEKLSGNNVTQLLPECYSEIEKEKELEIKKEKEKNINKGAKASDEGKPSKKSNKKKDNIVYYPDDKELNDTVIDFIEFRKNIKAPMTDRAVQIMVNKLNSMTDDRTEKIRILEQSMLNSWKGIFPLKGDSNYGYKGKDAKDKDNGEDYSDIGQSF